LALVAKGFAVLVPQRLGHGKTGGPYLEDQEGCDNAEYAMSARTTAEEIAIALTFIRAQSFARKDASVIVGHSAGGWGAGAHRSQPQRHFFNRCVLRRRGGRKDDRANSICAPDRLIAAAKEFGEDARVPVTWLVAENDSYFPPEFFKADGRRVHRSGDDKVDVQVLPPSGKEGHWLAEAGDEAMLATLVGNAAG
jgi:pimeloyl-ACP methyl ester carboxylesterase